jgi:hypothetical protein
MAHTAQNSRRSLTSVRINRMNQDSDNRVVARMSGRVEGLINPGRVEYACGIYTTLTDITAKEDPAIQG